MAIFTLETDYPSETGNPLEIHVRQKISLNLKTERLLTWMNAPYELIHLFIRQFWRILKIGYPSQTDNPP